MNTFLDLNRGNPNSERCEVTESLSYRISKALYEKHIPLVLTKIPKNGVTFKSPVTTFVT